MLCCTFHDVLGFIQDGNYGAFVCFVNDDVSVGFKLVKCSSFLGGGGKKVRIKCHAALYFSSDDSFR